MRPATAPRPLHAGRLLVVDRVGRSLHDASIVDLPALLRAGDVMVVNDAATLPASIRIESLDAEIRLVQMLGPSTFHAVVLGAGDWQRPTEMRGNPPVFHSGDRLELGAGLSGLVVATDSETPRLVTLELSLQGAPLYAALYTAAKPIQYSYLTAPLDLWDVQTPFASRPWAFEMPSAGRPLSWQILSALRERGVELAHLTHAAGISSTGDPLLDARLPLPERYEIPEMTVERVARARAQGGRVIAVGTTVTRALESNQREHGVLTPGPGVADLRLGPQHLLGVVDGLLTGMHEPTTSHFELLSAFADRALLEQAWRHADAAGYLAHELGDSCLIIDCSDTPAARGSNRGGDSVAA